MIRNTPNDCTCDKLLFNVKQSIKRWTKAYRCLWVWWSLWRYHSKLLLTSKKISAKPKSTYRNEKTAIFVHFIVWYLCKHVLFNFYSFLSEQSILQKPIIQTQKNMMCPFKQFGSLRKTVSNLQLYVWTVSLCCRNKTNKNEHLNKLIHIDISYLIYHSI